MGLKFRRSFKIAPGIRINVGKKSHGVSIGNKYGGFSVNSKTGVHARISAPGTGLSYTQKISGPSVKGRSNHAKPSSTDTDAEFQCVRRSSEEFDKIQESYHKKYVFPREPSRRISALALAIVLGIFGAPYFYVGRIWMGILCLFTLGGAGILWIVSIVQCALGKFKDKNGAYLVD